jgi:hypothetical protein
MILAVGKHMPRKALLDHRGGFCDTPGVRLHI